MPVLFDVPLIALLFLYLFLPLSSLFFLIPLCLWYLHLLAIKNDFLQILCPDSDKDGAAPFDIGRDKLTPLTKRIVNSAGERSLIRSDDNRAVAFIAEE
jgi:hypothetical protein